MSVRYPLYLKVLLWFFVNLAVLAVAGYVFFAMQLRLGLDSLLSGKAGERIVAVSEVFSHELLMAEREEWREITERFSVAYGADFSVLREDGNSVGGRRIPRTEVPQEVRDAIKARGNPMQMPRMVRPGPLASLASEGASERILPDRSVAVPLFLVRAAESRDYWAGVRIKIRPDDYPPPLTGILVLRTDSLLQGGLFFDAKPWIMVALGVVVFCVLFWIPLVGGITRSLRQMTAATERVAEGDFSTRVNDARGDELGRLGGAVNRMARRLEGFVNGQKRFLGDIAHELCSPLARMQMALGVMEQKLGEEGARDLKDVREEVEQMADMVAELLAFSKASLQAREVVLEPVILREFVDRVVETEGLKDGKVSIETEDVGETVVVMANERLLARSLGNLLRNAVAYAGSAGPIRVESRTNGDSVDLVVSDCGPGIAEESLQKIFDPFFRPEEARTREGGGVGLGLAIVKAGVEACRGTVSCRNREPQGLEVTLSLASA